MDPSGAGELDAEPEAFLDAGEVVYAGSGSMAAGDPQGAPARSSGLRAPPADVASSSPDGADWQSPRDLVAGNDDFLAAASQPIDARAYGAVWCSPYATVWRLFQRASQSQEKVESHYVDDRQRDCRPWRRRAPLPRPGAAGDLPECGDPDLLLSSSREAAEPERVVGGLDDRHLDFRVIVTLSGGLARCTTVVRRHGALAGTSNPLTLHDLAATWLSATGRRRRILLPVAFPGAAGRAFKDGANLCPGQSSAGPTWTQYLQGSHSPEGAVK